MDMVGRRTFFQSAMGGVLGSAGALSAVEVALAGGRDVNFVEAVAPGSQDNTAAPQHHIRFSVIGVSHDHILGMTAAVIRGGGELVAVYAAEPDKREVFLKRYPQAKVANSEDEILNDSSIQLILSATIPVDRAPLGIRVMKHGKDYLSDKPGITTLEQLADVNKAIAETKKIYAILYSERLEVKAAVHAGDLVKQGAIGKVVQTVNLAPHQVNAPSRPAWFWDPKKYGGIICDIGSHQVDQFLFYTGSKQAEAPYSQIGNFAHPDHPEFQDFGDVILHGDGGVGYVRVDWFTPDGLGVWGDGRLFLLGTEGYIELRKYVDIAGRKGGNHLFLVDKKEVQYIDCSNVVLPFGPLFVADIVNRTHMAQDQEQCLLAAELVIRAQKNAHVLKIKA
ncbi:MAG TPA: Gfo/Idh/MocA family oxidoreductase [Candidatus Eisenbacteria bacterium]|jgi:predicted dehydrogenase|nr:Gfo/Idh/MocA family oxidoreductase [Candidatus Eisenbacteria bacterium]